MARRPRFKIDMHIHSKYSGESPAEPRDIVDAALERGLWGIVITEHERLSVSAPFDELQKETPNLLIMRGVEVDTDAGHMLVYGVRDEDWKDWGAGQQNRVTELIIRVASLGGIVVPAHPYRLHRQAPLDDHPLVTVDERILGLQGISAIEVCNGKHLRFPAVFEVLSTYARSIGLPGIGGSDAHMPDQVGRTYSVFPKPIHSDREMIRHIVRGHVRPGIQSCKMHTTKVSSFPRYQISG